MRRAASEISYGRANYISTSPPLTVLSNTLIWKFKTIHQTPSLKHSLHSVLSSTGCTTMKASIVILQFLAAASAAGAPLSDGSAPHEAPAGTIAFLTTYSANMPGIEDVETTDAK